MQGNFQNPLSVPDTLPNKLILNVYNIHDAYQGLVLMFHPSVFWPDNQPTLRGMPCPDGIIFLYQSVNDNQFVNDWNSNDMYITILVHNNPLQDGPPTMTLYMRNKDAVELLSSNNSSELYNDKGPSKENPNWSNDAFVTLWHQKAYPDWNPLGYLPDPVSPRGCNRPIYNEPPSYRLAMRSQVRKTISTVSRTCKDWFAMGVICSPTFNSVYLPPGGTDLQRARCSCNVEFLDDNMSASFRMVTQQSKITDILNSIL